METGIRGRKTRRRRKKENVSKISEPTAHNHSPDSAQLRLECVIRDRPDVTGLAKKKKERKDIRATVARDEKCPLQRPKDFCKLC